MNNRKVYRKRLIEKVEDKEARHKTLVDKPVEIRSVDGILMILTDDEKRKLAYEIQKRMEDKK